MNYSRDKIINIAFYNVENLFDTIDDPLTNDDKFTPSGIRKWTNKRYFKKLQKISYVISQIGKDSSNEAPAIVGLVEVENTKVLNDLIHQKKLLEYGYRYVHYESKDERGIDTALLYRDQFFDPVNSRKIQFDFIDENGERDHTRDVLLVSGFLNGELIHIIVNHWPSRREGEEITRHKRIKAAKVVQNLISEIREEDQQAKIIIMGDFNDNPSSESIKDYLVSEDFYNPMFNLHIKGLGSLTYKKEWFLFDQIIVSNNLLEDEVEHKFIAAKIFNKRWLKTHKGKHKGSPFRTYIGPWYKGGFSDHFPIYVSFLKK
ncbi:endonuclease/exonuclease/phosphatase family protein [Tenacibaculum sp. ZS6-P6]|uniref:endonuclease/exonuclease/phosphatase family protein n=1 Tax=Tenacibaculum sp. ZS6-P6 TaxID=3447503 RepID=UPI003F9C6A73